MKRYVIGVILLVVAFSCVATAVGVGGGILVTGVTMDYVNLAIDEYNTANTTSVSNLHLAWGGEAQVTVGNFWGLIPSLGLRGLSASSVGQREHVAASLVGLYGGGTFFFGGWGLCADVGAYRGAFSFPAAGYDGLVGWSGGITGGVSYGLHFGSAIQIVLGLRLQWLPVWQLADSEGGMYASRDGAFLDFSGAGVSIGVSWTGF